MLLLIEYLWKVTTGYYTLRTWILIILVGCLYYGSIYHIFRACPQRANPDTKHNVLRTFGHMSLPLVRPYLLLTLLLLRHQTSMFCQLKLTLLSNDLLRNLVFSLFLHALIVSPHFPKNRCQFKLTILCLLFASILGWSRMKRIRYGCYSIPVPPWILVTWTIIFG